MKLKLTNKIITENEIHCEKYKLENNTFTTYTKKNNILNKNFIYTNFAENIENDMDYYSYVSVKTFAIDNIGLLYFGGDFNKIGDLKYGNIACWNGKKFDNLNFGLDGQIISLCVDNNNNLFVGGSFGKTRVGDVLSSSVIMWNSYKKKWISLDGGVNNVVTSIKQTSDGLIVVAGYFSKSVDSETPLEKIAYWNNNIWTNIGADFLKDTNIYAMDIDNNNNIYVGGYYLSVSVYNWNTKQWTILVDNNSNELSQIINSIIINPHTQNPIFSGYINDFGTITNVFNVIEYVVKDKTWKPLTNSNGFGLNSQCYTLYYDKINNQIIAGGYFTNLTNKDNINGLMLNHIATWNGVEWKNVQFGLSNNSNVEAFTMLNDTELLIAGNLNGDFTKYLTSGIIVYTNNYANLCYKDKLLYTLTNFKKTITISINESLTYIFEHL